MSTLILDPFTDDEQARHDYWTDNVRPERARDERLSGWTWLCIALALVAAGAAGVWVR